MNNIVKFFTNWTKKKAIISTVSVLTVAGLGLGTWAVWPLLGLSKTKSSEQVEKSEAAKEQELTYYQDVVVRAVSNEKDLSVSFVDGAGEIPSEKLSVKLVRVGKADDVDMEELNQSTASDMFNMDEYAANKQDDKADASENDNKQKEEVGENQQDTSEKDNQQDDNKQDNLKSVDAEVYKSGIDEYTKKLEAVEGEIYTDEDGDGTIHEENIEPGIYQVWYVPSEGYFPEQTITNVEINDKVEFKVDTQIEKKVEKYNAAQDVQPAHVTVTENEVTDTVGEVASSAETVVNVSVSQSAASDPYANCPTITDESGAVIVDKSGVAPETQLTDDAGNLLYVDEACTTPATAADYVEGATYYYKVETQQVVYTGWQTINGETYYYDANHNMVTGQQTIGGVIYNFNDDGTLVRALGAGIDVSKFQGNIDWNRVKASGINYAIIRCGGRYSGSRGLFEDPKYAANVAGASAAGLRVGIYFYSTATNTTEAVEEASLAVALARKGNVSLPVFIDMEDSMIPKGQATAISQAFCQTVNSAGYTSGVYANINWWTNYLDYGTLSPYKIWIARYNSSLSGGRYTWNGRCDYWQYSETGHVDGISGTVDLDYAY
jgi:GH25 family lysozyme M1 (1,4-beta-N-acetylmuramidase)